MSFKIIDPNEVSVPELHGILLGSVAPRPIAFASTVDSEGNINLSPFSFFNVFSANPPIMIFSPARRGRDNTTKHTLENVQEVPEVAISIVSYPMVEQMSLASSEYPKGVNEYEKAGFTQSSSLTISPPFVSEAPVSFECKVNNIIALGEEGGAGNLVICQVQKIHIQEEILNSEGKIDPQKLDAVARMGGNWYSRAQGDSLFEVAKPLTAPGIGIDNLPTKFLESGSLSGNDLGRLGTLESLPTKADIDSFKKSFEDIGDSLPPRNTLIQIGRLYLDQGDTGSAYCAFYCALNN